MKKILNKKAFTLIEMAIAMTILAFVIGTVITISNTVYNKEKVVTNKVDMEKYRNAIIAYASKNGKLPYPDMDGDGKGDASATGIGDIPYIDLQLSQKDIYGMPYKYDLNHQLATSDDNNICTILNDINSTSIPSVINDANDTTYGVAAVLISMGKDKQLTGENNSTNRIYEMNINKYDETLNNDMIIEFTGYDLRSRICNLADKNSSTCSSCILLPDGLVAYYRFEGNADDCVGDNEGTDTNVTYEDGRAGQAAKFDGTAFVSLTNDNLPTGTSTYSLVAWVKPTSVTADGIIAIGTSTGSAGTQDQLNSLIFYNSSIYHDWWGNNISISATDLVNSGWHMIVGTYNGTDMKLYIDGVEKASQTDSSLNIGNTVAYIGQRLDNEKFEGLIDEVRIYNKALSADDINTLYKLHESSASSSGAEMTFETLDDITLTFTNRSNGGTSGRYEISTNPTNCQTPNTTTNKETFTSAIDWIIIYDGTNCNGNKIIHSFSNLHFLDTNDEGNLSVNVSTSPPTITDI